MHTLDQFYTQPAVARTCWNRAAHVLKDITHRRSRDLFFIEPSAGRGDFYDLLPTQPQIAAKNPPNNLNKRLRVIGLDIAPTRKEFIKADFLNWNYQGDHILPPKHTVIIGNPPFGHRGDLAVKFINKAAELADTIAFIVPVIFRKYFIHKRIPLDMQWVDSLALPRASFYTTKNNTNKTYNVNTEFQIWTRLALPRRYKNKRLFTPPPIKHTDFIMHQYNNTQAALKVFDNDFDFAVPSQGWQDYTRRETQAAHCEKHKQWILFKTTTKTVFERLHNGIDYLTLAMKHTTSTPGFRKGDVVHEYIGQYG